MKTAYPSKAVVIRMVEAARACGLDVGAVETEPDGTIRILEARAAPVPANDFDQWKDRL